MMNGSQETGQQRQDMSTLCGMYSSGYYAHYRVVPQDTTSAMPTFRHSADDHSDEIQLGE
jgi:hypothetical protein